MEPSRNPPVIPEISVVIPCLNEEDNVANIILAVKEQLAMAEATYEIIVIDNASSDRTVEIVKGVCALDPRVRLIVNTRNFGQMRSPTHAIYQTRGRAVIGIGADFQDPPYLIPEFIARWRRGVKIVLAVRQTEATSWILKALRAAGYSFFRRFGDYPIIKGATGFGLYDRHVVDELSRWREPEPFFRAMLVESGFCVETVEYVRPPRAAGETKNGLSTLIGFATSGLAGSSKGLLRAPIYLSPIFLAAALSCALAWLVCLTGHTSGGHWLILAVLQFNMSLVLFFIGLVGEQVRVISERTRQVSLVVEKERINFNE